MKVTTNILLWFILIFLGLIAVMGQGVLLGFVFYLLARTFKDSALSFTPFFVSGMMIAAIFDLTLMALGGDDNE